MADLWRVCFIPATKPCSLQKGPMVYAFNCMYLLFSPSPPKKRRQQEIKIQVTWVMLLVISLSEHWSRETCLKRLGTCRVWPSCWDLCVIPRVQMVL